MDKDLLQFKALWKRGTAKLRTWKGGAALACVGLFLMATSFFLMEGDSLHQADTVLFDNTPELDETALGFFLATEDPNSMTLAEQWAEDTIMKYVIADENAIRIAVPTRYMMVLSSGLIVAGLGIAVLRFGGRLEER